MNHVTFELFCRPAVVPDLLQAASVGVLTEETLPLKLPSGDVMDVPCVQFFWPEGMGDLAEPLSFGDVSIAQVFRFPVDEPVRAYCQREDQWDKLFWLEGREYIRLGYVYLSVSLGQRFACVAFNPATKRMAELFVESPAIRSYFLKVLEQSQALGGAINSGWGSYYLLEDPSREIANTEHYVELFLDPRVRHEEALDRLIGHVLQQLTMAKRSA